PHAPPALDPLPTRRSSDLDRGTPGPTAHRFKVEIDFDISRHAPRPVLHLWRPRRSCPTARGWRAPRPQPGIGALPIGPSGEPESDRKTTRLNSSHVSISYA